VDSTLGCNDFDLFEKIWLQSFPEEFKGPKIKRKPVGISKNLILF
jgi:hypothetical protein